MWCRSGAHECDGCMACHSEPRAIAKCSVCGEDIVAGEDFYDIDGETIHDDCLREWAEQYRGIAPEEDSW